MLSFIPGDLILVILQHCEFESVNAFCRTCTRISEVCSSDIGKTIILLVRKQSRNKKIQNVLDTLYEQGDDLRNLLHALIKTKHFNKVREIVKCDMKMYYLFCIAVDEYEDMLKEWLIKYIEDSPKELQNTIRKEFGYDQYNSESISEIIDQNDIFNDDGIVDSITEYLCKHHNTFQQTWFENSNLIDKKFLSKNLDILRVLNIYFSTVDSDTSNVNT